MATAGRCSRYPIGASIEQTSPRWWRQGEAYTGPRRNYLLSTHGLFRGDRGTWSELDPSRPRPEQDEWDAHAAFMDGLVEDGFVVLGGPVGDGAGGPAPDSGEGPEKEVEARLAEDPWMSMGVLRIDTVEPWEILLDGRG